MPDQKAVFQHPVEKTGFVKHKCRVKKRFSSHLSNGSSLLNPETGFGNETQ
jgi:hypothetical protein